MDESFGVQMFESVYQLCCKHEHCLQRKLVATKMKKLCKTWPKQLHDHEEISLVYTEIKNVCEPDCCLMRRLEISLHPYRTF